MAEYYLTVDELNDQKHILRCRDKIYLSGTIITARDAAHKRLFKLIDSESKLPFAIKGSVIYFAGPTPTKSDNTIGSFGPTTSCRMDAFSPMLYDMGMLATIGKGNRNKEVLDAIIKNKALYFCAEGGCGALISKSVKSIEEIAFPELGCESIKKLYVEDMPLITAVDTNGVSIFERNL